MDMVKGAVSDQVMGQLGGLLGTGDKTSVLFESAAGSILGGLLKKSSTPQGAQDIFGAAQNQDAGMLDKLGDLFGGGDATEAYQQQGAGVLDMVLGGGEQRVGMIGTIAKALGVDGGIVGKLLAMAAPIVMGVIGKHIKDKALDAVGLGSFLGSQKSNIAGALPSGLAGNLGFANFLGDASGKVGDAMSGVGSAVGGAAGSLGDAAGKVGGAATRAADQVGDAAGEAASGVGNLLKLLLPLILLGALAWFLIPMFTGGGDKPADGDKGGLEMPAVPDFSASIPGLDALGEKGKTLTDGFSMISGGLKDVSDEAGATDLAGKITDFTGQIGGLGLGELDGAAKTASSSLIGKFVDSAPGLLSGKSDGIMGILKPVIDKLIEALSPFK